MYHTHAAMQLLQANGQQRQAAGPGTANDAAAGAALEVVPANDTASAQPQRADQHYQSAGKQPSTGRAVSGRNSLAAAPGSAAEPAGAVGSIDCSGSAAARHPASGEMTHSRPQEG